jgi:hypothetical protein
MNNLLLPVGIAVLVAFNIVDMITTRRMIDGGKGRDLNPVMAWLSRRTSDSFMGDRLRTSHL